MRSLRALLERLHLGRRPPTGPLTTAEKTAADEREIQAAHDDGGERAGREHEEGR